ncbi:putative flavin-containing polyamine oxidase [Thermoascus aurantiacus ATCC 26904]
MRFIQLSSITGVIATWAIQSCAGYVSQERREDASCRQTTVAILGGGMAGIAAAQALSNSSISDFLIIEYRDTIGGRVAHTTFGEKEDGTPYIIELGENWVFSMFPSKNPVWTLAKKYNLTNTYSNYSSILTYDETGYSDYSDLLDDYDAAYEVASEEAGGILTENLQDQTARSGLSLAGWKPKRNDMHSHAVEWWNWDFEDAYAPDKSSFVFGIAGDNLTFNQFSDENNFVFDDRGYNAIIQGEASTFLKENDNRLLLNTEVTNVSYSKDGVTIYNRDGSCISAAYAICTFSLGVLQNGDVSFTPEFPRWKETAIRKFSMGTYTKIFLQFDETFWPVNKQYFLYASPTTRGYYPVFQSLSTEGFLPGSNIIFATIVDDESYRVMEVLRQMFPDKSIPEPTAFFYPRWSTEPWSYGSYSNWPPSTSLEIHENLRANVDRLWFAGEATSAQYFGFLHGAWFEGREAGEQIAVLLQGRCADVYNEKECGERRHYAELHGSSPLADYSIFNGWAASSFYSST